MRPDRRIRSALIATVLLAALGGAWAHATLVLGEVTLDPDPPRAGQPFEIHLELEDPTGTPVADAIVEVAAVPGPAGDAAGAGADEAGADAAEPAPDTGGDAVARADLGEVAEGSYRAPLQVPEPGPWLLRFVDRTFPEEEVRATVSVTVGADEAETGAVTFLFPPTSGATSGIGTWLTWLVALPLVAAVVVTLLVLRRPPGRAADGDAGSKGEAAAAAPRRGAPDHEGGEKRPPGEPAPGDEDRRG